MTKGTAGAIANIKTMDGSAMPSPLAMNVGDYAYGTVSVTKSDLTNFSHFYRKNGSRVELGRLCKANAASMMFKEEAEPGTPVPPEPPSGVTLKHAILVYSDGSIAVDGIPFP